VVDFGEYDGKRLGVYSGRYGFYGKIGDLNFYLPKEMKHDQSRLSELTKEQMIELSKSAKPAKRARKKR
jgi:topoisomerase IA-like protein